MMLPASPHRARPRTCTEPAVILALLLVTALLLLETLPAAREVLRNLSQIMNAGFACLGQPSWSWPSARHSSCRSTRRRQPRPLFLSAAICVKHSQQQICRTVW